MPEDLHHYTGGDVLCEQQRSAGVSNVVKANAANACFGDEFIEEAVQIARLDDRADARRKDQSGVDPGRSKRKGFGSLICAVGSERLRPPSGLGGQVRADYSELRRSRPAVGRVLGWARDARASQVF